VLYVFQRLGLSAWSRGAPGRRGAEAGPASDRIGPASALPRAASALSACSPASSSSTGCENARHMSTLDGTWDAVGRSAVRAGRGRGVGGSERTRSRPTGATDGSKGSCTKRCAHLEMEDGPDDLVREVAHVGGHVAAEEDRETLEVTLQRLCHDVPVLGRHVDSCRRASLASAAPRLLSAENGGEPFHLLRKGGKGAHRAIRCTRCAPSCAASGASPPHTRRAARTCWSRTCAVSRPRQRRGAASGAKLRSFAQAFAPRGRIRRQPADGPNPLPAKGVLPYRRGRP
jgi:hypothetical protein